MIPAEHSTAHTDPLPCNILHPLTVRKVSKQMPPAAALGSLAEFFKLFSDKTRLGILWALFDRDGQFLHDRLNLLINPSGGLIYGGHFVGGSNMFSAWSARRELIRRGLDYALIHGTGASSAQYGGAAVLKRGVI